MLHFENFSITFIAEESHVRNVDASGVSREDSAR